MIGELLGLVILVPLFWLARVDISKDSAISIYIPLIIIFTISHLVVIILLRVTFHYSIEQQFLTLRQGILSKQQRHIPYGVIQNLFITQDLFDRIFGLASLTIENASQGAGAFTAPQQMELVGFSGNRVSVPGLTKSNAEILKGIILQRMKENPIEDSQSGL